MPCVAATKVSASGVGGLAYARESLGLVQDPSCGGRRGQRRRGAVADHRDAYLERGNGGWVPPHWQTCVGSAPGWMFFCVHEGVGRALNSRGLYYRQRHLGEDRLLGVILDRCRK